MSTITYEIRGIPATQRKLTTYPRRVQEKVDKTTEEYAFLIQRQAQTNAAVDTGFMRNNIMAERLAVAQWAVLSMADYSAFVEFGTRNTPAQPFLFPAARQYKQAYIAAVQRDLRAAW